MYRNKANNLNKKLKKKYYNDILEKAGNDMKKTWKVLKELIPENKNINTFDTLIDGTINKNHEDLANAFNNTFHDVYKMVPPDEDVDLNSMNTFKEVSSVFLF